MDYSLKNLLIPFLTFFSLLLCQNAFSQDFRVHEFSKLPVKVVNCVAIDFKDTKWIATEQGVYALQGDNLTLNLPPNTKSLATSIIKIDETGNKWIGTYNSQVYCLTNSGEWKYYSFKDFGDSFVSGLDVDSEQNIWVALYENMLVKQDKNGQRTSYTPQNSNIESNRIFALFVDKHDAVWVGTEKGLFHLEKNAKKWRKDKIEGQINAIAEYDGALWVTLIHHTGTQFWKYENFTNWKQIALPEEIKKDRIKEIAFDAVGRCWLAASHIAYLEADKWTTFGKNQGFSSEAALDVATDMQGQVWVGTEGKGLFKVGTEVAQVIKNTNEPFIIEPDLKTDKPLTLTDVNASIDKFLNKPIKLNITFEQSKAILTENSVTELDRLAKLLQQNPTHSLEILGHTDNIGNPVANQRLSEERSEAVKAYLTEKKISADRIKTIGYGGSKPIADNKNEKTRPFNRRVEIILLKKK
jgi:outer membrane protein OmpA-like peptidoglycan-associated protein